MAHDEQKEILFTPRSQLECRGGGGAGEKREEEEEKEEEEREGLGF